jgi:hypothetical protein
MITINVNGKNGILNKFNDPSILEVRKAEGCKKKTVKD